jgi:hypothetical protein
MEERSRLSGKFSCAPEFISVHPYKFFYEQKKGRPCCTVWSRHPELPQVRSYRNCTMKLFYRKVSGFVLSRNIGKIFAALSAFVRGPRPEQDVQVHILTDTYFGKYKSDARSPIQLPDKIPHFARLDFLHDARCFSPRYGKLNVFFHQP